MSTQPTKTKLKIGLVLDDTLDTPDGVQQYVLGLGVWLTEQGHDVRYLVGKTNRQDIPGVVSLSKNVAVRFNGNRMSMPLPTSRRHLRKYLSAEQFDVLHIQMPYSPFMAHRLIRAASPSTAIIGTFHILPESRLVQLANRALAIWLRGSLQRFSAILSVSSAAAQFARNTYRVESQVVPNMVDYQLFHSASPLSKYQNKILTILFLGRLVPRKGCGILLEAVRLLAQDTTNLPDFKVVVCGKGPLKTELEAYVLQNGLQDIVSFAGFVSETDKPHYYASADIAVFPSSGGESFGIVLLEAMASGKAVVLAGDNPGYHSVMEDRTEYLFPPRDVGALAHKLQHFLVNTDDRLKSARAATEYASSFDKNIVGQQVLNCYRKALHK